MFYLPCMNFMQSLPQRHPIIKHFCFSSGVGYSMLPSVFSNSFIACLIRLSMQKALVANGSATSAFALFLLFLLCLLLSLLSLLLLLSSIKMLQSTPHTRQVVWGAGILGSGDVNSWLPFRSQRFLPNFFLKVEEQKKPISITTAKRMW